MIYLQMSDNPMKDEDQKLLMEFQKQSIMLTSPNYSFEKISDQYSQVSENDESDIQIPAVPSDEDESESQKSRSQERKKRWKYKCCLKCTKSDKGSQRPKTCVCIVPASQRRIQIGEQGCLTCNCTGCSIEDMQKPKRKKPRKVKKSSSSESEQQFHTVNGCCKKCMKAFSKKGAKVSSPPRKACLCQVPKGVRKKPLPPHGCQYCGCHGCNPEDKKRTSGPLSPVSDELQDQNLNNFQHSLAFINWLNEQNENVAIFGIGIPQRTYSYIFGGQR